VARLQLAAERTPYFWKSAVFLSLTIVSSASSVVRRFSRPRRSASTCQSSL
jgi:hypothetical protein